MTGGEQSVELGRAPRRRVPAALQARIDAASVPSGPRFVLAVDPGKNAAGVALAADRVIIASACVRLGKTATRDLASRCAALAKEVRVWCCDAIAEHIADPENPPGSPVRLATGPHELVCEWPQVYTRDKSDGDPNDLLPVAGVSAAIAAWYYDIPCTTYLPRAWKGTMDGDAMVRRIEARLRETGEIEAVNEHTVTYRHNAIDACGLLLFHFGRFERRRVIAR